MHFCLQYKDSESTFKNNEALFLELEEASQFPGNRYLVKKEEVIYDIWYATKSEKFEEDDIKRAKYMLDSVSISQ